MKLVLVGVSTVGKTCLITNFTRGIFDDKWEPTVLDVHKGQHQFQDKMIELEVNDTSGDPNLGVNRTVCFENTDCFMLCVSVNDRGSLDRIRDFKAQIKQKCPKTPILLVATKTDLRNDTPNPISTDEIKRLQKDHGFENSVETSSKLF